MLIKKTTLSKKQEPANQNNSSSQNLTAVCSLCLNPRVEKCVVCMVLPSCVNFPRTFTFVQVSTFVVCLTKKVRAQVCHSVVARQFKRDESSQIARVYEWFVRFLPPYLTTCFMLQTFVQLALLDPTQNGLTAGLCQSQQRMIWTSSKRTRCSEAKVG